MGLKSISTSYEVQDLVERDNLRNLDVRAGVPGNGDTLWEEAYFFTVGFDCASSEYIFTGSEVEGDEFYDDIDVSPGLGEEPDYRFRVSESDIQDRSDPESFVREIESRLSL